MTQPAEQQQTEQQIEQQTFDKDYSKYGFHDKEDYVFKSQKGLSEGVVREISKMKKEPEWMLKFRLKAFETFLKKPMPQWGSNLNTINFDDIHYYLKPTKEQGSSWDDVPAYIKNTFDRLGIPEAEQKFLGGVGAQYECLTGDTKIFTNPSGPKNIKSIKVGDKIFAFDEATGKIKPSIVKGVMFKGEREIFKVKIGTKKIKTTINHPFLALMHKKKQGARRGRYKREWRYLSDLKVGNLVAIAKQIPFEGKPYRFKSSHELSFRHNKVNIPKLSTEDLMWFLGLYLGDGFLHKEKNKARVEIAIPKEDIQLREVLLSVIKNMFGIQASAKDKNRIIVYSTIIARFIEEIGFGGKAFTKKIPEWAFSLPKTQILAFLGGYLDSDGHVRNYAKNHDVVFTSVNKKILEDIIILTMLCGLPASKVHEFQSKHPHDKERIMKGYRLEVSGNTDIIASRSEKRFSRFGKKRYYHKFNSAKNTSFRKHVNDFIGFAKIESIEPMGIEPVYDIEVENYHNFVAEGIIVHNSEVVYHKIRDDLAKQGVVFLDMDSGLREYPEIVKKYFSTVIPYNDNKFAALNSAVWSGGSFVYIPAGVKVDLPLQAYFRINAKNMGQFERTLIIAEPNSSVHYIEGCFVKGTSISTINGAKKIEDIKEDDIVLTHTGSYKKVYKTQKRKHNGILCKIKCYGDTRRETKITSKHPVLAVKRQKAEYKNTEWKAEWIEAGKLEKSDYIAIPIERTIISQEQRFFQIKIGRGMHPSKNIQFKIDTDKDFFRLVGYYMAEGSIIGENYIVFTFNKSERIYLDDVKELLEKFFGKSPLEYKEYKNGIALVLCSTLAARLFKQEFSKGSKNKSLPKWFMLEAPEKQAEFIKGYWRGDGSFIDKKYSWGIKRMFRINTISDKLAEQTRNLLLRLNVFVSINVLKKKAPRSDSFSDSFTDSFTYSFTLYANGSNLEKFANVVDYNISKSYINESENSNSPVLLKQELISCAQITQNYAFVPIKQIKKEIVADLEVYNFSVIEDESYVANGVAVHNCTAPTYSSDSLHSAVVELIALPGSRIQYTTIQNWSNNVYNLVTKRAFAYENANVFWVDGNLGCLASDTKIFLNSDIKPISEIESGNIVFSLNENFELKRQKVIAKKYSGKQKVYRLKTLNHREIKATANHPFLIVKKTGRFSYVEWTNLSNIKEKDMIAISGDIPESGKPQKIFFNKSGIKNITIPTETTDELMWLFGIYLGDGYCDKNRIYFAIPENDKACPRLIKALKEIFGVECKRKGVVLRTASIGLVKFFKEEGFGRNSRTKRVPQWIFSLPKSQRAALIEGYIAADGYYRKDHKNILITSNNIGLLEDVKILAMTCSLNPMKISTWTRKEKKPLGKKEKEYTHHYMYFGEKKFEKPITFVPVSDITYLGEEDTWDIEIEGSHNFVANGFIVHNSKITMKYPSVYLLGEGAKAEILSVAFAGKGQHQDAGGKILHYAPNTSSRITSKSVSKDGGRTTYRGMLKVAEGCYNVKSHVTCDALILDEKSASDTIPYMEINEKRVNIEHEATVGKIGEEQLFYLMSRGLSQDQAMTMIVSGFMEPFKKELPLEYAIELNRLILLNMEGSVG